MPCTCQDCCRDIPLHRLQHPNTDLCEINSSIREMELPVNATLVAGLLFAQEQIGSLREKFHRVNNHGSMISKHY